MSLVFISGSSDGLGLLAARLLVDWGHEVTLHARSAARVLAEHGARVQDYPTLCGPNLRANVEEGQRYSAVDVAHAMMAAQTAIYQQWQTFFANYDVIISPAITISPCSSSCR